LFNDEKTIDSTHTTIAVQKLFILVSSTVNIGVITPQVLLTELMLKERGFTVVTLGTSQINSLLFAIRL